MLNTIIHYEVITNIALIILVICLATYTFAQDMRLKKYKLLLAAQNTSQWQHQDPVRSFPSEKQHMAA